METFVFNDDNLSKSDINRSTIKARALIVNDKKEILLTKSSDMYILPGGKLESSEDIIECLKREIKEETGITLTNEVIEPLIYIKQLIKDYPTKDNKGLNNRLFETYYYVIHCNQLLNLNKLTLTKSEKENDFKIDNIDINKAINIVGDNISSNVRNKYYQRELLLVLNKYNK